MKNIFIAIGGSGTKVAEVLVRLLTIGFPITKQTIEGNKQILTSAGHTLEIWRLDSDNSAGASDALHHSLSELINLHTALGGGKRGADNDPDQIATSSWAMDVVTHVRELNPLELPGDDTQQTNLVKTLSGILDSRDGGMRTSKPFLNLLYRPEELDLAIDRGFYQKPFIGAPIMAIFSRYLEGGKTPEARKCNLPNLANNPARFFLCGSLHGGTGACGVPVMAKFLGELKKRNANWKLGGCMLAPYAQPPLPPTLPTLRPELDLNSQIRSIINMHRDEEPFRSSPHPEELIRQILLGFYAKPQEVIERAKQGLGYYKDHLIEHFDALYLVGKTQLDQLDTWSNGGSTQINPINSAEVIAAITALNFFAGAVEGSGHNAKSYLVGTSSNTLNPQKMRLGDLPLYQVAGATVDAEKLVLTAAVTRYLVRHILPWDRNIFTGKEFLYNARNYVNYGTEYQDDKTAYLAAAAIFTNAIDLLINPHPTRTKGWSGEDFTQLIPLLTEDASLIMHKLGRKSIVSSAPKEPITLGLSHIELRDEEFQKWRVDKKEFTRAEYLRAVWSQVLERAK